MMIRNLLAGAAIALISSAAYADESYSSQTTVVTPAPAPDSFSKSTTHRTTDAFGNQTERTDSVQKSQAMTPDGLTSTTTHSHTRSDNYGGPASSTTTSTTTTNQ